MIGVWTLLCLLVWAILAVEVHPLNVLLEELRRCDHLPVLEVALIELQSVKVKGRDVVFKRNQQALHRVRLVVESL